MRTNAFILLCLFAIFPTACSKKSASGNVLPFDAPAGWQQDTDTSRGLAYRNPADPKQSFRFVLLRFERPPRLTEKQIAQELQSLAQQESITLEPLGGGAYFAEASGNAQHDGEAFFRRQFFRVDKVSTTAAEVRTVSFFCPLNATDATKPIENAIRKGLHGARLSK